MQVLISQHLTSTNGFNMILQELRWDFMNSIKITFSKFCFIYILFATVVTMILGCLNGKWVLSSDFLYLVRYAFEMYSNLFLALLSRSALLISIIWLLFILPITGRQLKQKELLVLVLAVGTFVFWILQAIYNGDASIYELITAVGYSPVAILIPLTILVGFDDEIWDVLKKYSFPLATLFLAVGIYTGLQFRIRYGLTTFMGISSVKLLFVYGFWIGAFYCYAVIDNSKVKQYIICVLAVICALLTVSRSWLIQSLALTLLSISLRKPHSKGFKFLKTFVFVLILLTVLSSAFPNVFLLLLERLSDDSRSSQYIQFFQQVSFGETLIGKGYGAGYQYFGDIDYKYFDNQFICVMFHYGILPILYFLYIFARPIIENRKIRKQQKSTMRPYTFFLLHWLLAMAGLSIYFTFDLNLCSMVLGAYGGHCLKEVHQRKMQIAYLNETNRKLIEGFFSWRGDGQKN
jgi:hypothetical protein